MVVLQQTQAQIHTSGDPRRAVEGAVTHEQAVVQHAQAGEKTLQQLGVTPVSDHLPPIQQAGLRQEKGAGTDRTAARRQRRCLAQPAGDPPFLHGSLYATSAGHQQGATGNRARLGQRLGAQRQAGAGGHQTTLRRNRL